MLEDGRRPLNIFTSYTTQVNKDNWQWPNMIYHAYGLDMSYAFVKEMGVVTNNKETFGVTVARFLDARDNRLAAGRAAAERAATERAAAERAEEAVSSPTGTFAWLIDTRG